jgi:L-iditol 2-dehydrogenase
MKAIVLRGINDYVYTDVEKPECPKDGLLLKVKACGLCGSDMRTLVSGHKNVSYPWTTGHEVCGIVDETGEDYKGSYVPGDVLTVAPNVFCGVCEYCRAGRFDLCMNLRELAQHWKGGFAEYMAIPAEALSNGCIVKINSDDDYAAAAISEPPSSCISAQEKLGIGLMDNVLIIGSGPVGCIHICVAKARGARKIIVADISKDRLDMCKAFGDVETINSAEEDVVARAKELTDGVGPDVVITANPVGITQVQAIEAVKKGGRVAFFGGLPSGKSTPMIDTNLIHYKGLIVIGTTNFAPQHHLTSIEMLKDGRIPADKLITHRLPLSKFHEGVELARSGKALKVVFMP